METENKIEKASGKSNRQGYLELKIDYQQPISAMDLADCVKGLTELYSNHTNADREESSKNNQELQELLIESIEPGSLRVFLKEKVIDTLSFDFSKLFSFGKWLHDLFKKIKKKENMKTDFGSVTNNDVENIKNLLNVVTNGNNNTINLHFYEGDGQRIAEASTEITKHNGTMVLSRLNQVIDNRPEKNRRVEFLKKYKTVLLFYQICRDKRKNRAIIVGIVAKPLPVLFAEDEDLQSWLPSVRLDCFYQADVTVKYKNSKPQNYLIHKIHKEYDQDKVFYLTSSTEEKL